MGRYPVGCSRFFLMRWPRIVGRASLVQPVLILEKRLALRIGILFFFFLLWPIYLSESIYFMKSEFNGKFIPFLRRGNVFLAKMFIF